MPQLSVQMASVGQRTVGVAAQTATVSTVVTDRGLAPVYNVDYVVTVDGQSQAECHYELPQAVASYGASFTLPAQVSVPAATGSHTVGVSVSKINGQAVEAQPLTGRLVSISQSGHRRTVVEEFTGTWCVNCPRGHAGMQHLADLFGDDFIGIAAHNDDPMAIPAYQSSAINPGRFPHCAMNRTVYCDPYVGTATSQRHFAADVPFAATLAEPTEADIYLSAQWTDDATIVYNAQTTFYANAAAGDYALAFVLTADGLTGTGSSWAQVNGDSGDNTFPDADMDWWRQQPNPATGVVYNHVAVWTDGLVGGIDGSISAPITAGGQQTYAGTVSTAGNQLIQDPARLHLVAMLLDKASGQVVNAYKTPIEPAGVGIRPVVNDPSADSPLFDLQGRRVTHPVPGLYIRDGRKVIMK